MNKITKNTICPNFKIKKLIFLIQHRISQRNNQIFKIFGLYWFAFTALAIEETFTQRNFSPSTIEIVSMYFPIKKFQEQMRPKIRENLRTANFNPKFTGN